MLKRHFYLSKKKKKNKLNSFNKIHKNAKYNQNISQDVYINWLKKTIELIKI